MSTILKALDRLEREKREPAARTLQQQVVTPAAAPVTSADPPMRTPSLLAALAIGLGIGVGGLGLLLASRQPAASVAPAAPALVAQPPPPPLAVAAAAASAPERDASEGAWRIDANPEAAVDPELLALGEGHAVDAAESPIDLDPEVVVATTDGVEFVESEMPVIDPAQNARPENDALAAVAVVEPRQPRPPTQVVAERAVAKSAAAKPAAPKPVAAAKRVPAAKPRPAVAAESAIARESSESAPRAAAPSAARVRVVSTVWHPAGERRHAVVRTRAGDTREVREGDLVDGLLVDRIEPSRVVFSDGGMELIRRVGADR